MKPQEFLLETAYAYLLIRHHTIVIYPDEIRHEVSQRAYSRADFEGTADSRFAGEGGSKFQSAHSGLVVKLWNLVGIL